MLQLISYTCKVSLAYHKVLCIVDVGDVHACMAPTGLIIVWTLETLIVESSYYC